MMTTWVNYEDPRVIAPVCLWLEGRGAIYSNELYRPLGINGANRWEAANAKAC